jgi:hypothetical protein
MLDRAVKFITSLKLTVVCLAFAIVLVFIGTVAQVNEGLYAAQDRWFRSLLVLRQAGDPWWVPPVFPGGYLIGIVLLVNLLAAHIARFQFSAKKLGIHLTHAGVILLLVGQLATDLFSNETQMRFAEGETRRYSESALQNELVFITEVDADTEEVVAIPESRIAAGGEIRHEKLPFIVRVKEYHVNSRLRQRAPMADTNAPPATEGVGARVTLTPLPETRKMDDRNFPSAVVELVTPEGTSLGTWLASTFLTGADEIQAGDRTWKLSFRWARSYHPFTLTLLKTTHDVYPGTEIPKDFRSRVRIESAQTGENREVEIFMNSPLRYGGLTFYQYQMGRDELDANRGTSTLQVVRNPGWLTPYAGCVIVAAGLIIQFMIHLVGFVSRRKPVPA